MLILEENRQYDDLKFIAYCRKSSDREDKQMLSIPSQIEASQKIIEAKSLGNVDILSESKSAYVTGREKFNEMIKRIKLSEVNAILVWHLTRIARNSEDGGRIIYLMDQGLLKEIWTPEKIYRNTTDDKFLMQIHFAMAKKSSDDTSDFVKRDIKTKLKKGEYPGFCPRGYLNIDKYGRISGKQYTPEKQKKLEGFDRHLRRIEKDPILSSIILKLYNLCVSGSYTLNQLRDVTYGIGLTGERSKKKISKATLHRILINPFYYGAILWKEKIIEPEELPEDTRHEPIVSRELFYKVQEVLSKRNRPISKKKFYTYSNLMKCSNCGGNISGITAKGHLYYRCTRCTGIPYIREDELEKQILRELKRVSIDENFYNLALEEINKYNKNEVENRNTIQEHQERELNRCRTRLERLLELKISPENKNNEILTDEEYIKQRKEILIEQELIKKKLNNSDAHREVWSEACINYLDFSKNLAKKFKNVTPEERREVFAFIYYNPILNAKILSNSAQNPHKFIISYNQRNNLTITQEYREYKNKKGVNTPNSFYMRERRDSNSRPLA